MFLLVPKFIIVWALMISLLLNAASWYFNQPVDKVITFAESKAVVVQQNFSTVRTASKNLMSKI